MVSDIAGEPMCDKHTAYRWLDNEFAKRHNGVSISAPKAVRDTAARKAAAGIIPAPVVVVKKPSPKKKPRWGPEVIRIHQKRRQEWAARNKAMLKPVPFKAPVFVDPWEGMLPAPMPVFADPWFIPSEPKMAAYVKRWTGDDFYWSPEWRTLRVKVLDASSRRCVLCGDHPGNGAILHVDHIKPRSKYRHLELEKTNLQILCAACNFGKGNRYETDWR